MFWGIRTYDPHYYRIGHGSIVQGPDNPIFVPLEWLDS